MRLQKNTGENEEMTTNKARIICQILYDCLIEIAGCTTEILGIRYPWVRVRCGTWVQARDNVIKALLHFPFPLP